MAILRTQIWRPDTHPGHIVEIEWEYDLDTGRDTGREHRGVSVSYPGGKRIHRDSHGTEETHEQYKKLLAEHVIKNIAHRIIIEFLGTTGVNKHRVTWKALGNGRYEFAVSEIDDATHRTLAEKLTVRFKDSVVLLKSASPPGSF